MGSVVVFRAVDTALERLPIRVGTLDEATLRTGHGTYTVFRLYPGGRVLRLGHHLARMRHSAALLGQQFPHSDARLRDVIRRAVAASGIDLPRVRLMVPYAEPDTAIVALEPFSPPPPEVYNVGVRVALSDVHRSQPRAKDSRFIEVRHRLTAGQEGVFEVLLCDGCGTILEGASSNFYAVLDGQLHTAGEGMLEGIARSILLQVAPEVIPVSFEPIHISDLSRVSEALLTSSSRGVIPVVQIDGTIIGSGAPGIISTRLRTRYDAQVEAELEPL